MDDGGHAVSYEALRAGTAVRTSDGAPVGTVLEVLENERERIFDGIVIETPRGRRFVDAPEVARIAERAVTLSIDAAAVDRLPERDHAGGPEYRANPRAGRFRRLWHKR